MDFNENHYSVKQKIGDPGSKSIRNIFRSILSRQNGMNRHMEQHISFLAENPVFQFFGLEIYRTRVGQSDAGEGIGMGWESWREAPANSSWRPGPHGAQRLPHGAQRRGPKKGAQRKGTIFIDGP